MPVPDLERGAGLPLLWHWIYLIDRPAQADLGPDGHPVRGTLPAPPGPGRRRMWAGGRVRTRGPLRAGSPATKRTSVLSVTEKQGRSGHLTFVTVGHQISQDGQLVIDEEQDIVYREAVTVPAPAPAAEAAFAEEPAGEPPLVPPGDGEWEIEVSPTLLFRFSALTYNAHRIHYDRDYCRGVEGYPGLLTHGPLQALAMAEAAARGRPRRRRPDLRVPPGLAAIRLPGPDRRRGARRGRGDHGRPRPLRPPDRRRHPHRAGEGR